MFVAFHNQSPLITDSDLGGIDPELKPFRAALKCQTPSAFLYNVYSHLS